MKAIINESPGYYVTDRGQVFNLKTGREMRLAECGRGGYLKFRCGEGKDRFVKYIHHLVARAFIPNPDGLTEIHHKDCNPKNNCVENLEWTTSKKNVREWFYKDKEAFKSGTQGVKRSKKGSYTVRMFVKSTIDFRLSGFVSQEQAFIAYKKIAALVHRLDGEEVMSEVLDEFSA